MSAASSWSFLISLSTVLVEILSTRISCSHSHFIYRFNNTPFLCISSSLLFNSTKHCAYSTSTMHIQLSLLAVALAPLVQALVAGPACCTDTVPASTHTITVTAYVPVLLQRPSYTHQVQDRNHYRNRNRNAIVSTVLTVQPTSLIDLQSAHPTSSFPATLPPHLLLPKSV